MAVGVQFDFRGRTLEQYDQSMERVGLLPGGPPPRGQIFHVAMKTDNGVRCIDVWRSREEYENFWETRILPSVQEGGVVDPPEIQFFEVHNYFVGSRSRS